MKFKAFIPTEVEVNVGDTAVLIKDSLELEKVKVVKVAETPRGGYAAFDNNTWRPFSSYHKTWIVL